MNVNAIRKKEWKLRRAKNHVLQNYQDDERMYVENKVAFPGKRGFARCVVRSRHWRFFWLLLEAHDSFFTARGL
jgi:hypothetical protein